MKKDKQNTTQALRDLKPGESIRFPIRRKVSVVNMIQRLRLENYKISIVSDFSARMFTATKISNPCKIYD